GQALRSRSLISFSSIGFGLSEPEYIIKQVQPPCSPLSQSFVCSKCASTPFTTNTNKFFTLTSFTLNTQAQQQQETKTGYVTTPILESSCTESISVKLAVHFSMDHPVPNFTCDISSRVDHVISHVVCELGATTQFKSEEYAPKVWGMAEFLLPNSCLCDYEYV
ncbi:putative Phosphatidylinositol-4-phosphate 3-kinase C2 domain-containing subunit beta, partial [Daphnia magna]